MTAQQQTSDLCIVNSHLSEYNILYLACDWDPRDGMYGGRYEDNNDV